MNSPLLSLRQHVFNYPIILVTPMFCVACQDKLPLFVTDELTGAKVDILYPDVAFHLDVCPACLNEYESLSSLLNAALFAEEPA